MRLCGYCLCAMRIQRMRISGFKSFADPLDIEFRHRLTGIVGPNGCGKSNLFEAVRWAMGESFAKNIRAELGIDVICSGSGSRKPASRAEVELLFDNSDGRIGGKAGSWAEISVRRTIDRERESHYYLNGSRCRKRDIAALFSGTGFGPRSYSIIEQGMIARIIEAKPDELRNHLEEAAGVSSYRQSRRETETRMRSTRDNLERIALVVSEVERQMKSLQRQARQAERYHDLSAREKQLRAQSIATAWQNHVQQHATLKAQNFELAVAMEKERSNLQAAETKLERMQLELQTTEQACDDFQQSFHKLSTTVSVQEQECLHSKGQRDNLVQEKDTLSERLQKEERQLVEDDARLRQLKQETAQYNASLLTLCENANSSDKACEQAQQSFDQNQQQVSLARDHIAELQRKCDSSEAKCESLQRSLRQSEQRHEEIETELKLSEDNSHSNQLQSQREVLQELQQRCDAAKNSVQQYIDQVHSLREEAVSIDVELADGREKLRHLHGEFASLQALQNQTLKIDVAADVLRQHNLDSVPRLGERLQVTARWHLAVETVLNKHLQDLELEQPDELLQCCGGEVGAVGAYRAGLPVQSDAQTSPHPALVSLASQVECPGLPTDLLLGIWVTADIDSAMLARAKLPEGHSVITVDGVWFGRDWVRIGKPREAGTLDRAAELKQIRASYEQQQQHCNQLEQKLVEKREAQRKGESELQDMREQLQALQDKLAQQQGEVAVGEVRAADRLERIENLCRALTTSSDEQNQVQREIDQLNAVMREANDTIEAARQQLSELEGEYDRSRSDLNQSRIARDDAKDRLHQTELQHKEASSKMESLQESLRRQQQAYHHEQTRLVELSAELDKIDRTIPEQQQKLQAALMARNAAELQLRKKQEQLQQVKELIAKDEKLKAMIAVELHETEGMQQQNEVKMAEFATQQRMLAVQLEELGHTPEQLLESVAAHLDAEALKDELVAVQQKISALGQVNLAAIDEHNELEQRKKYLDTQKDDLEQALATLQSAIKRIDTESRKRFDETYAKVNANLQQTFSRLFSGGSAQLELLEQESGDPGVIIKARPPGKRGGLISILSGGEKTLVSLALIFSIFMLNPSPVCFMDEVDASLDDINIGRFTNMVRAMSQQLQFIFITHNKLTMEMADVLLGITMREAGVSRLVSVDTEEAIRLANSVA